MNRKGWWASGLEGWRGALRIPSVLLPFCFATQTSGAQAWNSQRAIDLARRAVDRRSGQISPNALASYSAKAIGYLTFLGQFGDTAIFGPHVLKQTQLAVDIYWHAPSSSKQIVVGMRDTLLSPADIDYYSDRYGIVQSNFPDRIRMGDGRDIADVMHPLSTEGLGAYDFAIVDSTAIRTVTDSIDVYQLMFRPRDPKASRAIGSAYLDVRNADVVRLDLTFTRNAILDKRIELLTVSLENAWIEGRAWLPRRQSIEVVRTGTWMRMNVRGIIRGHWDVDQYNVQFSAPPTLFTGPPISFVAPGLLKTYPFEGKILDALPPDVAIVRPQDIERVQKQAEDMVRDEFRERAQRAALSVPSLSDMFRVTRVEGVALGAGGELHPRARLMIDAHARYGFSDEEWKADAGVTLGIGHDRSIRAFASRDYADARDVPEVSGIRNSIAAQEFGSDYTDPFDMRKAGVELSLGRWARSRWRVVGTAERHDPLLVNATPERGAYEPTIPARRIDARVLGIHAEGAVFTIGGGTLRTNAELRLTRFTNRDPGFTDDAGRAARLEFDAEYERKLGRGVLQTRTVGAALSGGALPPQFAVYLGGPTTAPGYNFDAFAARRGVSQHVEWRADVPFFSIPLARYGKVPPHATLAPYVHTVYVDDAGPRQGWYPSLGAGFEPVMGMLRFDFARGLRDGRWSFCVDLARLFWGMM
ncbi:MAG TPA: hypothetical protein VE967_10400 [Gemmatimonadaceae bacterium]|nr:hypothetical protein [Gemmatimonadaceae bacterium]